MITLGTILAQLQQLVSDNPKLGMQDKLESLTMEYRFLIDFMMKGYEDDRREELYRDMTHKAAMFLSDVRHALAVEQNTFLSSLIKDLKGKDVSSAAIIERLRSEGENHYQSLSEAFTVVLVSGQWREQDSRQWLSYLLSDETPADDACIMVSAIMLSSYTNFSLEKFRTLLYVYDTTDEERLRQRALIGWMMVWSGSEEVFAEEQKELVLQVAEGNEQLVGDVFEALMQMYTIRHSDEANEKISKEIMPNLTKNNMLMMTSDGLDFAANSIEDVINPGESERRMNEMESAIRKVADMQKAGVDVFFKGFSSMKRYPFFYKIVNWFVPFRTDHPELAASREKLEDLQFMKRVFVDGPFCDSDKYSFAFTISHVFDQLPDTMKKFLNRDDVAPIGTLDANDDVRKSGAYVRRMYLQDLYRFFKLFPQNKFEDFFGGRLDEFVDAIPSLGDAAQQSISDFCTFLLRNNESKVAKKVNEYTKDAVAQILLSATIAYSEGRYEEAFGLYSSVKSRIKMSNREMVGYARSAMRSQHYQEASDCYAGLMEIDPGNLNYALNHILAEANAGRAEGVVNEAYRYEYENPDNINVKRILAWTLLLSKRAAKSLEEFEKVIVLEGAAVTPEAASDYLNAAYAAWFAGDAVKYVTLIKQYLECMGKETDADTRVLFVMSQFGKDSNVFDAYEATDVVKGLMLDALTA